MIDAAAIEVDEGKGKMLRIAHDLKLPPEAVTQTFAILAMRGVGKTYTASVIAEELSESALPFAVLDPTGAWYGLRSSADGKSDGYPVTILGGDHADAPLEETAGKVIADLLAEEAPPLILDMSRLSKSAMRRFVADFAERLYEKNRNPLHLIIDEADAFVPQKPRPDEMRMLGAIDEIVRRGRIRGLGVTLVTQRSAVLNKDVLTQTEVLVVLRTAHPRDRAPVLEWMKVHATDEQLAAVEESLAKLPKGDAWIMSAGWLDLFKRVHIRERRTFNSSATPEPGRRIVAPRKLAPVDLALLETRMKETIERAKASDPNLLRKRVAELQAELAKAQKAAPAPAPVVKETRVEVPVIKDEQIAELQKAADRLDAMFNKFADMQLAVHTTASAIIEGLESVRSAPPPARLPQRAIVSHGRFAKKPPRAARVAPAPSGALVDAPLKKGAREMLLALATLHPAPLTRHQVGTFVGLPEHGSTFTSYLSSLRTGGYIEERGDSVELSESGVDFVNALGWPEAPTSTADLVSLWSSKLKAGARAMLRELVGEYPEALARGALGEAVDLPSTGSTFTSYLSSLRKNGLIEESGDDVRASPTLFPEGAA